MHAGDDVPRVRADATLSEALVEMSRKRLGMTAVVDGDGNACSACTPTATCAARSTTPRSTCARPASTRS